MIDSKQLREALKNWSQGVVVAAGSQSGNPEGKKEWARTFVDAARFALTVLEQGEKLDWCEVHGASVVEELNGCGGSDLGEHCDRTPSLRISTAALRDTEAGPQ